jgi:hypothetical protein
MDGGGAVMTTDEEFEGFSELVLHIKGRLWDAPQHKKKNGEVPVG